LGDLAPKPLTMDNTFFKKESARQHMAGTYHIPRYIIISKFITFIIREVC